MRYEMKIILATLLTAVMGIQAYGNTPADSVKVYFRTGFSRLDPASEEDRQAMESFISILRKKKVGKEIDS